MKKYYKDFYGGTASITKTQAGYRLIIRCGSKVVKRQTFETERGAKISIGRYSDCWREN